MRTSKTGPKPKQEKKCPTCGEVKPRREFYEYRNSFGGLTISSYCKACDRKRNNKPSTMIYLKNRDGSKTSLPKTTVMEMLEAQNYACAICNDDLHDNYATDHCHESGIVRKILCPDCNKGLGFFSDDPHLLRRAIEYIENF